MISTEKFFNSLTDNGFNFFCGVPDSLLKNICAKITDEIDQNSHVITSNEGSAVALAAGYHIATNKVPFVYMQNSGLGNAINPLTSLAASEVYGIPMLLLIGWRGEPGVKDEPQHEKKGALMLPFLESMKIPYYIIPDSDSEAFESIKAAKEHAIKNNTPFALIARVNLFDKYKLKNTKNDISELGREEAIKIILEETKNIDAIYLGNTGKIGRELFEVRKSRGENSERDFLNVGSMGHTSQIALGIAMNTDKMVFCLDGDGALIMHMGGVTSIGQMASKNYVHIVLNNVAHDSVGGQPTLADKINFLKIANACGYKKSIKVYHATGLRESLKDIGCGPIFIEVLVKKGARSNLARPDKSPSTNKKMLMDFMSRSSTD